MNNNRIDALEETLRLWDEFISKIPDPFKEFFLISNHTAISVYRSELDSRLALKKMKEEMEDE